jgi:hypothetical protein
LNGEKFSNSLGFSPSGINLPGLVLANQARRIVMVYRKFKVDKTEQTPQFRRGRLPRKKQNATNNNS